jgi:maltose-binding protein MalE
MPKMRSTSIVLIAIFASVVLSCQFGCRRSEITMPNRVLIWHQMRPDERDVLQRQIERYMKIHPDIVVAQVYKETEELRSGYVIASIAGQGPDLVYGPSDPIGVYEATKTIRPLENLFTSEYLSEFDTTGLLRYKGHLYQIADKIGNHLALVYNKKYVRRPPTTDEELIRECMSIQARFGYVKGKPNVYGLAWNYTEPFFFVPFYTGFGGWIFNTDGVTPTLDNAAMVNALNFVRKLRDVYKIIPAEADYNIADALFKDGKSAMIINGDWSWAGYAQSGIDIGVAPLPMVTSTNLWCAPMTSPKGYSINVNVPTEKLPVVLDLLYYILSEQNELELVRSLNIAPTRKVLYRNPDVESNDILRNSLEQIRRGKPMPVVPEMRAIWDAMRPSYQAVMGGAKTPEQAAREMQKLAVRKIRDMYD